MQLSRQQDVGLIKGLRLAQRAPSISHLFFADDALFFLKGTIDNCWKINKVLRKFCELSGEMINQQKSYAVCKNNPRKFIRLLNKGLKVETKEKLGKYLECPMDVDGRTLNIFQELHQKADATITSSKLSHLHLVRKMILINNILVAYSSYVMATYMFPPKDSNKNNFFTKMLVEVK